MRHASLLLIIFFLCSCSTSFNQIDLIDKPQFKLDPKGKILVATPKDGRYKTRIYNGSGQLTSQAVKASFLQYTNFVEVTSLCTSRDICLNESRVKGKKYLVYPEIVHWEDRAPQWSGFYDRLEVKLTLLFVDTGEIIHSTIISGKSNWVTFGGNHPQDLLPEAINRYVETLY